MPTESQAATVTVRDRFLADHRRLEDLFERLLAAFKASDRELVEGLWSEFDAGLSAHMEAEESHLFPLLLASQPRDVRTLAAEHKHIRARLIELGIAVDLHLSRLKEMQGFVEELRAHARHEDSILYRWADDHLGTAERTSLFGALTKCPGKTPRRKSAYADASSSSSAATSSSTFTGFVK